MSTFKYNIGYALSGGFIKGFAHLGIMQALHEHGITPDILSGVSAGALAAVFYADGREPYHVIELFEHHSFTELTTFSINKQGLLKLDSFIDFLESNLRTKLIEELSIPTIISATDLDHGKIVSFRKGKIAERVAAKVFRSNLSMIDLHFPRMLGEMLRIMHLDGITRVSELTEVMKQVNPLKIKEELIGKHHYYEYKMKQFLLALALGMRPAKLFTGVDSAVSGFLLVDGSGEILCYQKADRQTFADFLFYNSRFEKGSTEKDKYGYLERENGVYYFKLNAKIGLLKR